MHKRPPSDQTPLVQARFCASRRLIAGLLVLALAIGGPSGCSTDVSPKQLLIENVNVVDPVNGLLENRQVLIEDGVIKVVAGPFETWN